MSFVNAHFVSYARDLGYHPMVAASGFSLIGFFALVGALVFGHLSDKYGRRKYLSYSYHLRGIGFAVVLLSMGIPGLGIPPLGLTTLVVGIILVGITWNAVIGITAAFACQLGAIMHTATLPGVTASHTYEDDLITEPQIVQRGFMKVPDNPGLGVELDEDAVDRYRNTPIPEWERWVSVITLPAGVRHYYRDLRQAENLMKLGNDESYARGVRLEEWEDDGSDKFDRIWKRLQTQDMPIWEAE